MEEFAVCGHNILGPIYLVVFITLGAFIFANLVVAVVVTNLVCAWSIGMQTMVMVMVFLQEWVIAQKNERLKKFTRKQDARYLPSSAYEDLFSTEASKIPQVNNPGPSYTYLPLH